MVPAGSKTARPRGTPTAMRPSGRAVGAVVGLAPKVRAAEMVPSARSDTKSTCCRLATTATSVPSARSTTPSNSPESCAAPRTRPS